MMGAHKTEMDYPAGIPRQAMTSDQAFAVLKNEIERLRMGLNEAHATIARLEKPRRRWWRGLT